MRAPLQSVHRRLAVWRKVHLDGQASVRYISLTGENLSKREAGAIAAADKSLLQRLGVASSGPASEVKNVIAQIPVYEGDWTNDEQQLAHWYIPRSVKRAYESEGVKALYPWQAETLRFGERGRSVVYAAPTSGGKSLVAEILIARAALFEGVRSLVVLPHVALCTEKTRALRRFLGSTVGLDIQSFHGSSNAQWHGGVDVAICTFEKANAIVNRLAAEVNSSRVLRRRFGVESPPPPPIGLVVVDECHLVGDEHRGFLMELLLTKLRLLQNCPGWQALQVVALSATLPNIKELSVWLDAELIATDQRPLPLEALMKFEDQLLRVNDAGLALLVERLPSTRLQRKGGGAPVIDHDNISFLTWQRLRKRQQVLVFCATKDWCLNTCLLLSKILPLFQAGDIICTDAAGSADKDITEKIKAFPQIDDKEKNREILLEQLRASSPEGILCSTLEKGIVCGVAYHHAGLPAVHREIIETAFRDGLLLCLCATSTLAVGVNLPVSRVIFRNCQVGNQQLDSARYRQMAGRAGRKGFDVKGESILICQSEVDKIVGLKLMQGSDNSVQKVYSALRGTRLSRLVFELVVLRMARQLPELQKLILEQTLLGVQLKLLSPAIREIETNGVTAEIEQSVKWLSTQCMVGAVQFELNAKENDIVLALEKFAENCTPDPLGPPGCLLEFADTACTEQLAAMRFTFPRMMNAADKLMEEKQMPLELRILKSQAPGPLQDNFWLFPTKLGTGVLETSLSPGDAIELFTLLAAAQTRGLPLNSPLPLLLLIAPLNPPRGLMGGLQVDALDATSRKALESVGVDPGRAVRLAAMHLQVTSSQLHEKWMKGELSVNAYRRVHEMQRYARFSSVLLLNDIILQVPLGVVLKRHRINAGELQQVQSHAVFIGASLAMLAMRLGWIPIGNLLEEICKRMRLEGSDGATFFK